MRHSSYSALKRELQTLHCHNLKYLNIFAAKETPHLFLISKNKLPFYNIIFSLLHKIPVFIDLVFFLVRTSPPVHACMIMWANIIPGENTTLFYPPHPSPPLSIPPLISPLQRKTFSPSILSNKRLKGDLL